MQPRRPSSTSGVSLDSSFTSSTARTTTNKGVRRNPFRNSSISGRTDRTLPPTPTSRNTRNRKRSVVISEDLVVTTTNDHDNNELVDTNNDEEDFFETTSPKKGADTMSVGSSSNITRSTHTATPLASGGSRKSRHHDKSLTSISSLLNNTKPRQQKHDNNNNKPSPIKRSDNNVSPASLFSVSSTTTKTNDHHHHHHQNNTNTNLDITITDFNSTLTSYDPQKRTSIASYDRTKAKRIALLEQYGMAGDHALPWEKIPATAPQVTLLPHFLPLPKPPQQSQPKDSSLYRVSRVKMNNSHQNVSSGIIATKKDNRSVIDNDEKNEQGESQPNQENIIHQGPSKRPDGLNSIFAPRPSTSSDAQKPTMNNNNNFQSKTARRPQTQEGRRNNNTSSSLPLANSSASSMPDDRGRLLQRAATARAVEEQRANNGGKNAYGITFGGEQQVQENVLRTTSHRTKVPSLLELARAIPSEALDSLETLKRMLDEDGGLLDRVPTQTVESCSVVLPVGAPGAEFGPQRRSGRATSDEVVNFLVGGIGFNAFRDAAFRAEDTVNDAILDWQSDMSSPNRSRGRRSPNSMLREELTKDTVSTVPTHQGYVRDWMFKNFIMEDGGLAADSRKRKGSVADGLDPYSAERWKTDGVEVDQDHVERAKKMMETLWGKHAKTKWITVAKHYAIVKKALREISDEAMPMFKMMRNKLLERTREIFSGDGTRDLYEKLLQEKAKQNFLADARNHPDRNRQEQEEDWERRVSVLVHQGSMNLLAALQQEEEDENGNNNNNSSSSASKGLDKITELLASPEALEAMSPEDRQELFRKAEKSKKSFEILARLQNTINGLGVDTMASPTTARQVNADSIAFKSVTEFISKNGNQKKMKRVSKKIKNKLSAMLGNSAAQDATIQDLINSGHDLLDLDSGSSSDSSNDGDEDFLLGGGSAKRKNKNKNGGRSSSAGSSSPPKGGKNRQQITEAQKKKNRQYRKYSYFSKDELQTLQDLVQEDPQNFKHLVKDSASADDRAFSKAVFKLMNEATGSDGKKGSSGGNKFQTSSATSDALGVSKVILEKVYEIAEEKFVNSGMDVTSLKQQSSQQPPSLRRPSSSISVNNIATTTTNSSTEANSLQTSRSGSPQANNQQQQNTGAASSSSPTTSSRSVSPSITPISTIPTEEKSSTSPSATTTPPVPPIRVAATTSKNQQSLNINNNKNREPFVAIKNRLTFGGVRNNIPHSQRIDVSSEELGLDHQKHIRPLIAKLNLLDNGFKKALQLTTVIARAANEIPINAYVQQPPAASNNNSSNVTSGSFRRTSSANMMNRPGSSHSNHVGSFRTTNNNNNNNNNASPNSSSSPFGSMRRRKSNSDLLQNDNNNQNAIKNAATQAFVASAFKEAGQQAQALREGQVFKIRSSNDPNISNHGNYYLDMWFTCERAAQAIKKMSSKIRDASLQLKMRRRRTQAMLEIKNEIEKSYVQAAHDREKKTQVHLNSLYHQSSGNYSKNNNTTSSSNNNNNNNTSGYQHRRSILDRIPFDVRPKLFGEEAGLLREARRGALFSQKKSDRTAIVLNQLEQPVYGDGSGDRRLALAKRIMENQQQKQQRGQSKRRERTDPFANSNARRTSISVSTKNRNNSVVATKQQQEDNNHPENDRHIIGALGIIDEKKLWDEVDQAEDRLSLVYSSNNINNTESSLLLEASNNYNISNNTNNKNANSFLGAVSNLAADSLLAPDTPRSSSSSLTPHGSDRGALISSSNKGGRKRSNNSRRRNHQKSQQSQQNVLLMNNNTTNHQTDLFNQSFSRVTSNRSPSHESGSSLDNTLNATFTSIVDIGAVYSHNLRDVAIQNCIEDERTVNCYELLDQLRSEETASIKTIDRVANTSANLGLLVSGLESDMVCPRCLQVLRQPQIIAPCGTTVCRSCVLSNDDQRHDDIDAGFTFRARQDCGCQIHEGTAVNRGLDSMLNLWPDMKNTSSKLTTALNEIVTALHREGVTKDNVTSDNLKKVKDKAAKSMMNMSMSEVESFAHSTM